MEYRCKKCGEPLSSTSPSDQPPDKRYAPMVIVKDGDETTVQECSKCGHVNEFKKGLDQ